MFSGGQAIKLNWGFFLLFGGDTGYYWGFGEK